MKFKDYEICIKSPSQDVREVELSTVGCAFVGVVGERYSIHIENNNCDYRIWTSLHIDGVPVMLDGWGLIANPNCSLSWDGFQIDANTEREFVFVENLEDSIACSKNITGSEGIMEIRIVRENVKWELLSPPEPLILNYMMTGMGESKKFSKKQAKIKFKWGGPDEIIKIHYGSESDLAKKKSLYKNNKSASQFINKNNIFYKITVEKNNYESFSYPHAINNISYAVIDCNSIVELYKGQRNVDDVDEFIKINLSHNESKKIIDLVNSIIINPVNAKNKLNNSQIVIHISHLNTIFLKVEKFNSSDFSAGTIVLSWECNAMFVENGLLKDILEAMKL